MEESVSIKLLLTGGDKALFERVVLCLSDFNAEVSFAQRPRDCLARLKSAEIDVVILDKSMLVHDSGQALGYIRASAPRSAIICLVPYADEAEALSLIRFGADEVVSTSDLDSGVLARTVGRAWQRANAGIQITSQISDFVLTNSFDGILTLDLQNRVLLWNHAMERMFGRKREDVLGKVAVDVLPFEGIGAEISRAVSGLSFAGQTRRYLLRGVTRVITPYYAPLTSRSGQVVGAMATFRDLTDSVNSDFKVKELSERLAKLADTVPKMVWMAGVDGSRNYFNGRWYEFTGVNVESLLEDGWLVGVHPRDRPNIVSVVARAADERDGFHLEYRMRRSDNTFRRILDSGTPILGPAREFLGFIGTCTDISESGTTQHRIDTRQLTRLWSETGDVPLKSAREQVTSTMEDAPIGVWKLDRDLVITKASRAVADQLGVDASQLVGLPFSEVVGSIPKESLESVLREQSTVQLTAHRVDFGQGESRKSVLWDLAAWPLKDKSKEVIGVCISTIEVDDTADNDKLKEDFIATLVHDLKTPLIGADRTLEMMIAGGLGDVDTGQSEVLAMLRRSNQGLLRMVQNLIEVY
ncbi:MAG: PAS domain-containing protein, partial [Candidatus Obscuribacterales bacterium]|nr:PAS domain-containing protein [Candidatus Obscuribacterales bacterium]